MCVVGDNAYGETTLQDVREENTASICDTSLMQLEGEEVLDFYAMIA